jgi:hypothetical protein
MSDPDDDQPLDPAAARVVAKVRWLMLISGVTTMVAIAAVLSVIGYRVFKTEGSAAAPADVTAVLPKGARIVATAVARTSPSPSGQRRARDPHLRLRTLKPTGRLRFARTETRNARGVTGRCAEHVVRPSARLRREPRQDHAGGCATMCASRVFAGSRVSAARHARCIPGLGGGLLGRTGM